MEAAAACGSGLKETTERGRGLGEGSALGACLRAAGQTAGYAEKRKTQGAKRTGGGGCGMAQDAPGRTAGRTGGGFCEALVRSVF